MVFAKDAADVFSVICVVQGAAEELAIIKQK
jgi:hypothetical protein